MNAAAFLLGGASPSHLPGVTRRRPSPHCVGVAAGLALASLLPVAASSAQEQESVAARIARENLPAVVTLIAVDDHDQPLALGSGFFISRDGVLVTNAHVVAGAARVFVRWRGQSGTAVRILNFARKYDLVTVQTSFTTTPASLLANSDSVTIGQDVVVLGSPQGLEGTVSTGIVGGLRTLGSTLASLTASLQNRTSDTIADVRVLVVVKNPRGEVLDFHLRDFKGTVIPPGLAKQVSIPIATRGFRTWSGGIDPVRGTYEIRLLDYKIVGNRGGGAGDEPIKRR